MKPITTKAHGVLDYAAVVVVFVLPRLLHWSAGLTQFMTWMAAGALLYTLLTRFELGAIKVLPVPAHLVLDFLVGAAFLSHRIHPAWGAVVGPDRFDRSRTARNWGRFHDPNHAVGTGHRSADAERLKARPKRQAVRKQEHEP